MWIVSLSLSTFKTQASTLHNFDCYVSRATAAMMTTNDVVDDDDVAVRWRESLSNEAHYLLEMKFNSFSVRVSHAITNIIKSSETTASKKLGVSHDRMMYVCWETRETIEWKEEISW